MTDRPWVARAARFPLDIAVRFRHVGAAAWEAGQTVNVSGTGLLVRAAAPLPAPAEPIEVLLGLAEHLHSQSDVVCVGRVVRVGSTGEGAATFAAGIDLYRFIGHKQAVAVAPAAAVEGDFHS